MSETETPARRQHSSLGDEIVGRIEQLAAVSEAPGHLTRIFLTPQHLAAAELILGWMQSAGMRAHLDAIGNVCGRYEGGAVGLPCLMLGSHYDTVHDAGKWDGPLGLLAAIACVADLHSRGRRLPFAVEVTCAPWLRSQLAEAVAGEGFRVFELPSGAGHDGMAMIDVADVAMLFVRCKGGISHHPDEHVDPADADAGARVLLRLIENFRPRDMAP